MPTKDIEKQKQWSKEWYERNKRKVLDSNNLRRRKARTWLKEYKEASPCMDCKVKYPYYVMEFDHRPGTKKIVEVSKLVNSLSFTKLQAEIAKCDLVCVNCHRERTFGRIARADKPSKHS